VSPNGPAVEPLVWNVAGLLDDEPGATRDYVVAGATIDLHSGHSVVGREEGDDELLRLTDHHELDLETPVREAIQLAEPIAPLCRPDCPGLCLVCGERLDEGVHDHPDDEIDPRLEALRAFKADDG